MSDIVTQMQSMAEATANKHEINPYQIFFISTIGSQNYNLDDDQSDCDCMAVFIPNSKQLMYEQFVVKEDELDCGIIKWVDYRHWAQFVLKGNPNYLETIPSIAAHAIGHFTFEEQAQSLKSMCHRLVNRCPQKTAYALAGAASHDFAKAAKKMEQEEYVPKCLASGVRNLILLEQVLQGKPYEDSIVFDGLMRDFIIRLKRGRFDEKRQEEICRSFSRYLDNIKKSNAYLNIKNYETKTDHEKMVSIFKDSIVNLIQKGVF